MTGLYNNTWPLLLMIADNTLRSISYMIPEQENSQKRKKLKETNLKKKTTK